jgi:hypothetical protein
LKIDYDTKGNVIGTRCDRAQNPVFKIKIENAIDCDEIYTVGNPYIFYLPISTVKAVEDIKLFII